MNIVLCVLAASILAAMAYVWNDRSRRAPLAAFGVENVQRVGTWESPAWRESVWSRGWTTCAE